MTDNQLAIYMPDEDIDRIKIGKELDLKFMPLVNKVKNGEYIKAGLFLSNIPLEEMQDDGSMLIRLTPKHTIDSLAAETRCRYARRCLAPRGSALSGFTPRVPPLLS
jgi:hypothetical protein